jgi:hypothetical protein
MILDLLWHVVRAAGAAVWWWQRQRGGGGSWRCRWRLARGGSMVVVAAPRRRRQLCGSEAPNDATISQLSNIGKVCNIGKVGYYFVIFLFLFVISSPPPNSFCQSISTSHVLIDVTTNALSKSRPPCQDFCKRTPTVTFRLLSRCSGPSRPRWSIQVQQTPHRLAPPVCTHSVYSR